MTTKKEPAALTDRYSYLWLALGAVLLLLSTGQFRFAFAAWLAPVFIIRFFRIQNVRRGLWTILIAMYLAYAVGWFAIMAPFMPPPVFLIFIFGVTLINTLPYLADRLLASRIAGFTATLVFPLAVTAVVFVYNLFSPIGSFGTFGYEQYNNLPLIQIVSITGLWGLTFLVSWCGPVVNWAWENDFRWRKIRPGLAIWAGVLLLVLLYGSFRLALADLEPGTVQIHGVSVSVDYDSRPDRETELAGYRAFTQAQNERLMQASIREAEKGADVVLWSEMAGEGIEEDIDALIARAQEVAREENIYLAMGLQTHFPGQERPWENKIVVVDPSGEVVIDHDKFGATFIYGAMGAGAVLQGEYAMETAQTPFGTLSGAVCWDADFPMTIRQAGRNGADILLVANGDAPAQAEIHVQQHIFRAIENGFSLVRHDAAAGYSAVADPYGRVLAMVDLDAAGEPVMSAQVPTQRVFTLYPIIGDFFGWLSLIAFAGMVAGVILERRREPSYRVAV